VLRWDVNHRRAGAGAHGGLFWENCARYCTDMSTAVTELNLKEVNHRVKHYYGCGGRGLV